MNPKLLKILRDVLIAILTAIITALSAVSCLAYSNPIKFANTKISNCLTTITYGFIL